MGIYDQITHFLSKTARVYAELLGDLQPKYSLLIEKQQVSDAYGKFNTEMYDQISQLLYLRTHIATQSGMYPNVISFCRSFDNKPYSCPPDLLLGT